MSDRFAGTVGVPLAALLACVGCDLANVEVVVPVPDVMVVEATAVLTVDPTHPAPGHAHILAIATRYPDRGHPHPVHGASIRVTGESGQSMQLSEEMDPVPNCVDRDFFGACYRGSSPLSPFDPGEMLSLEVVLPDGGVLYGTSRMPGTFSASDLALEDGRCRLSPDTNYRFKWAPVEGAAAYLAELGVGGVGEMEVDDRVSWTTVLIGNDLSEVAFPRGLLAVLEVTDPDLAGELRTGLPEGAVADIALGAVDLNWTNWIREGRINLSGDVRVPSVFGDGTGWFGTAVRWRLSVESREANGDNGPPLCGPPLAD
ncbi:MAG: hypothetical protein OXI83_17360 [Gemmatimonadota bacterium]|nr:hypothetical protein [Gemmatimonadota bacterium]